MKPPRAYVEPALVPEVLARVAAGDLNHLDLLNVARRRMPGGAFASLVLARHDILGRLDASPGDPVLLSAVGLLTAASASTARHPDPDD